MVPSAVLRLARFRQSIGTGRLVYLARDETRELLGIKLVNRSHELELYFEKISQIVSVDGAKD